MLRLSSLLSLVVLLVSVNPSLVSSSRLSSPSDLHRFLLSRRFSTLTAPSPSSVCSPTYGCLPEGFPVPDPSTVHFIQFPNGVNVNLEGYGTVSLPQGYPVFALPSYDSASNTVKDPYFSTILAYALSEVANPNFNGVWGGFTLPGVGTGVGDGDDGTGGEDILSTGVGGGVVETGSSTGVSVILPSNTGTSTGSGGITHGGTGGTVSSTGSGGINNNNNNNNNNNPPSKNGGSTLAGSIGLVAGLAMAAMFASLF
jgi:hypothetical protein